MEEYQSPKERLKALTPDRPTYANPDGMSRDLDEERKINEAFALVFDDSPASYLVLQYLRSITLNLVNGPENLDNLSLAHREGQRYIMALIDHRVALGRKKEPHP
jgi:hypothetical protein